MAGKRPRHINWLRSDRADGSSVFVMPAEYGSCRLSVSPIGAEAAYVVFDACFREDCVLELPENGKRFGITYCAEGSAFLISHGQKERLDIGSLIFSDLLPPESEERDTVLYRAGTHYLQVSFFADGKPGRRTPFPPLRLIQEAKESGIVFPFVTRSAELARVFENTYREQVRNPEARKLFLESRLLSVSAMLIEHGIGRETRRISEVDHYELEMLEKARTRMLSDFAHPPKLNQIAREVGMNETKLKKEFKLIYGEPIYQSFKKAKLQRAMDLLSTTNLSVREVAFQCGYSSQGQFCTAFRNLYELTPREAHKKFFVSRISNYVEIHRNKSDRVKK
jgi:AraC-like DNA-binding protein